MTVGFESAASFFACLASFFLRLSTDDDEDEECFRFFEEEEEEVSAESVRDSIGGAAAVTADGEVLVLAAEEEFIGDLRVTRSTWEIRSDTGSSFFDFLPFF